VYIGETALSYDWQSQKWLAPVGLCVDKLLITDRHAWDFYVEYRKSLVYKDWLGSALENAVRLNVTYTVLI
jgi:hypothetical protein